MRIHFHSMNRPKAAAKRLHRICGRRLSECQEIIAKTAGYTGWQELVTRHAELPASPDDRDLDAIASIERQIALAKKLSSVTGTGENEALRLIGLVRLTGENEVLDLMLEEVNTTPSQHIVQAGAEQPHADDAEPLDQAVATIKPRQRQSFMQRLKGVLSGLVTAREIGVGESVHRKRPFGRIDVSGWEGDLVIGMEKGRAVKVRAPSLAIMISAAGGGKTSAFVFPNLLSWKGSVVAFLRDHDAHVPIQYRRGAGQTVRIIDPSDRDSDGIDAMAGIARGVDPSLILKRLDVIAAGLFQYAGGFGSSDDSEEGYDGRGRMLVKMAVLAMLLDPQFDRRITLVDVRTWMCRSDGELASSFRTLQASAEASPHQAQAAGIELDPIQHALLNVASKFTGLDEDTMGVVLAHVRRHLGWLDDPTLARRVTLGTFNLSDLTRGKTTVLVSADPADSQRVPGFYRFLAHMFASEELNYSGPEKQNTLFILDAEGINFFGGAMAGLVECGRSAGASILLTAHSIDSFVHIHGESISNALRSNAGVELFGDRASLESANYVSKLLGKIEFVDDSGLVVSRDILSPDEVLSMPRSDLIACVKNGPCGFVEKAYHWKLPDFQGRFDRAKP